MHCDFSPAGPPQLIVVKSCSYKGESVREHALERSLDHLNPNHIKRRQTQPARSGSAVEESNAARAAFVSSQLSLFTFDGGCQQSLDGRPSRRPAMPEFQTGLCPVSGAVSLPCR